MGNKSSSVLQDDEIQFISQTTGFTGSQIEKLHSRFSNLDRNNRGSLGKSDFMAIQELSINPLGGRLVHMFFIGLDEDTDRISFPRFVKVLSTFRSFDQENKGDGRVKPKELVSTQSIQSKNSSSAENNSSNDKPRIENHDPSERTNVLGSKVLGTTTSGFKSRLEFVFKLYDYDSDGKIGFKDLKSLIKTIVGGCMDDSQLDKIALRAFVEVDEDNNGFIDFEEFHRVFIGRDLNDMLRVKFFH